jgi:hypothetical protein
VKPRAAHLPRNIEKTPTAAAPSAHIVAHYLAQRVCTEPILSYDTVAREIATRFGAPFVIISHTGRLAIRPDVLHAFYERTKAIVVWSRGERAWRLRTSDDAALRQVD